MANAAPNKQIQVQDLPRVNEISLVLAKNGFGHVLTLLGLTAGPAARSDAATGPFARRVRQVLIDLGPTYIKLGQVLSVRPDILPADVMAEFQTLQDRVPAMPFEDVREVVESELTQPLDNVFSSFDPTPLGSASIAQVHAATLIDGTKVAVKLQRKGIERTIRSDLHILYSLAQLLEGSNVRLPGLHTPTAIVREFDAAISDELDFLHELKSAERLRRALKDTPGVYVPEVHPRWSTRRMMVMEHVHAQPLNQAYNDPKLDRAKVAHAIMEATFQQAFDHGFFHGDPHPGNVFVDADSRVIFLDFGVMGTLTGAMQDTLINAFTSMVFRDAETLAMAVYRAGATNGRVDLRAFTEELERKMIKYYGASLDDLAQTATFVEIVQLCTRFKISLPPEFAVLSRAIGLVESEVRTLLPGVDIVEEVKPYAQRLVTRRFSPDRVMHDAAKLMVQAQGHFRDLPTQMTQMMMDLEGGNVTIVTRDPDASALREEIRAGVLRLSLAALATTVTMGSLLFLAAWSPAPFGIPVFGLIGGMFLWLGIALFGALGVHVLFAHFLNLRAWRNRAVALMRFFSWRRDK